MDGKPTKLHEKYVYALGNHCILEDSRNASARNRPPTEKADRYVKSDFKTATHVGKIINSSGTFGAKEILGNSTRMMNSLIEFYNIKMPHEE